MEGQLLQARLRGKMRTQIAGLSNPVAVGDWVRLERDEEGKDTNIAEVLPRDNYIIRRSPRNKHHKHIVASNLDQALLVVTLSSPRTSLGFIDRFLVNTGTYHIPTALAINKADLLNAKEMSRKEAMTDLYRSLGHEVLLLSALSGEGMGELRAFLSGKTTLLAGHSGVGKSSIANALEPGLGLRVKEVSSSSGKGLHTTTFARMHKLDMGGYLVDTPGIKEFGIVDLEPAEVGHYFPEMAGRMEHCRFNNCMHRNEPGCAVLQALEEGLIAPSRYDSYISILEDVSAGD